MAFIAVIHIDGTTPPDALMSDEIQWPDGSRLVGIFAYPGRRELGCSGTCTGKGRLSAFARDHSLGFMKCKICGMRNRKVRTWLTNALFDFLGANLYPKAPAVFRTPEGYGPSSR
jgi:hypothetical protein